jgi:hypothetical protein
VPSFSEGTHVPREFGDWRPSFVARRLLDASFAFLSFRKEFIPATGMQLLEESGFTLNTYMNACSGVTQIPRLADHRYAAVPVASG